MTTPQFPPTLFGSMEKYMGKAVTNREEYYRGLEEAKQDYLQKRAGSPYVTAHSAAAAEQQFQNSPKGKELIGNNRWYMMQAVMFGVGSIAEAAWRMAGDIRAIRLMMEYDKQGHRRHVPQQRG